MKQGAPPAPALRAGSPAITVLRAHHAQALVAALEQAAPAGAMVLPAGPYRYPYAWAHELALRLNPPATLSDLGDHGVLHRAPLARALAPLLRGGALVLPRADWLDAPSLELLLDLVRCNLLLACPPLRVWVGLTHQEPAPALRPLLDTQWAHIVDLAPGRAVPPPELGVLGDLLSLAPQPIARNVLIQLGIDPGVLGGLASAGLVHDGPRVGWGPAFEAAEPHDPQGVRQALVQQGCAVLPGARFALGGQSDALAAAELARACWQRGEHASAARYYHLSRLQGQGAADMRCGRALAAAGYIESAQALFTQCKPAPSDVAAWMDRGPLAAMLALAGSLEPQQALKTLRKAERLAHAGGMAEFVEPLAWRARLLLHMGRFKAAQALLRRVGNNLLAQAAPSARRLWLLQMARCHERSGSMALASRCLQRALDESELPADRLQVALAMHKLAPEESTAQVTAEMAIEILDAEALALVLPFLSRRQQAALAGMVAEAPSAQIEPMTIQSVWRWLHAWGATLVAVPTAAGVHIEPPEAASRPGLAAWLQAQVQRLQDFPDALYLPSGAVPNAGKFAGNLLALRRLGPCSPALVVLARDKEPDLRRLLDAIRSLREQP